MKKLSTFQYFNDKMYKGILLQYRYCNNLKNKLSGKQEMEY